MTFKEFKEKIEAWGKKHNLEVLVYEKITNTYVKIRRSNSQEFEYIAHVSNLARFNYELKIKKRPF